MELIAAVWEAVADKGNYLVGAILLLLAVYLLRRQEKHHQREQQRLQASLASIHADLQRIVALMEKKA